MKKLFAILAVASVMTACNNSAESKEGEVKDTTTAAPATSVAAEAQQLTDTTAPKKDSTAPKTDTAAKH
mgnify:CR=1 FL=1